MRRLLTVSVLLALALFTTAAGQPAQQPKSADDKKADKKVEKKLDPTDAAIAAALANDPDVRMAKAKIQLAEAELAKARQAVTLKVVALKAKIDQLKVDVRAAEDRLAWATAMFQKGALQQSELLTARDRLDAAKGALALAETEWKLLTGTPFGSPVADLMVPDHAASALAWLATHGQEDPTTASLARYMMLMTTARESLLVKGPIPERIRAALDKPVKLGAKGEKITFEKALEVFKKEAGLDVPIRGVFPMVPAPDPKNPNEFKDQPIAVVSEGEELPVGAWFQLFEDNAVLTNWRGGGTTRYRFYVREYGLFISPTNTAPPDAPPLTEFWKQKSPAKDVKEEPKPK